MENAKQIEQRIYEAERLRLNKQFEECLTIIEAEVQKLEAEKGPGGFCDDEKTEYYATNNLFERGLIRKLIKHEREVAFTDVDYAYMFFVYALVLYDFERFEEAKIALEKAMRWNPVNVNVAIEYSMIFKKSNDHEQAFAVAKKALEYAYTPALFAFCLYNISTYFIDTELYSEAVECLSLTLHYQRDYESVFGALDYVSEKNGTKVQLGFENIKTIAEKYGFLCSVNKDVWLIAFNLASYADALGYFEAAKQYIEIVGFWSKSNKVNDLWDHIVDGWSKEQLDDVSSLKKEIETWEKQETQEEPENHELFRNEINSVFLSDSAKQNVKDVIEKTREEVSKKNFEKALSIIQPCVQSVDEWLAACKPFDNTATTAYLDFRETFESILYEKLFEPVQKKCNEPEYPLGTMYLTYGGVLMDLKRYDEAAAALRKALRWSPTNADIALEYAVTFQFRKLFINFFQITKFALRIAFRKPAIARCYRNFGFYFSEREMWSEAVCCYKMSLNYDKDSKMAKSELDYISKMTDGAELPNTDFKDFVALGEKYGFPVAGDPKVFKIAYDYGTHYFEEKVWNAAQYYLKIANEVHEDDNIKRMLAKIVEKRSHIN